jgi:fatty acid amide hydrolase
VTALWERSATELAALLAKGEVSSREVVDAHLDRIASVDGSVRAFTEVFRERARADADARDNERRAGNVRGPLHGLPVSLKECFDLEGQATTLGLTTWRDNRAPRDASLVTLLREAGAVFLGRTNLSQTMLFSESRNPVYGQTANPFSLAHTPGGSSGGEAAAVAAGMSPLGVGTDIGGSLRSPAHFSGVCTLKPTLDRLPSRGQSTALKGQEAIRSAPGPMARTVGDLWLFFNALDPARMSALDGRVAPLAWSDPADVDVTGLTVGWYTDDGVLPVSRAVARGVERAREVLSRRGCRVIPFGPKDVNGLLARYLGALSADGGVTLREVTGDGPIDPVMASLRQVAALPDAARKAAAGALSLAGQKRTAMLLRAIGEKSVAALWKLTDALRGDRAAFLDAMAAAGVDAIVCPAYATPALPHGMSKNFTFASSTAITYNAFQLPAGVVPVTRVRRDETTRDASSDLIERHAAKVDAESEGLPVGVQVVARPWQEATVLAVMAAIEADVRDDADFPRTPVTPR